MKRTLVIGAGSIGERHVRCFLQTGRTEVSVCEPREDLRTRLARDYDLAATYAAWEETANEPFDAAVICTPAPLHIPMATDLIGRGVPVLIEKPLSTSVKGVDELISLAGTAKIPAVMAYVHRHNPLLGSMRGILQSGRFGPVVEVIVASGQHFPFYRPAYRETYYTRHETGGGAIQDALTHLVNATEWLVGPTTSLVADAKHCVLEGVDVEDTVHLITRHADVLGSFSMNQHQPPNETSITVICREGAVRLELHRGCLSTCSEPDTAWTVEESVVLERDELFVRQAAAFLDVLDGKAEPSCTLAEGKQTLAVNLAALASVRDRAWHDI